MSQLSAIKERLRTISNLRQVTKAMELITKTKINKIRQNSANARSYQELFTKLFYNIKNSAEQINCRNTDQQVIKKYFLGFLSQKGFCGDFNEKLLSKLASALNGQQNIQEIYLLGKKTSKWNHVLKRNFTALEAKEKSYQQECAPLIKLLSQEILDCQKIEIFFVFNKFKSVLEQTPAVLKMFPFELLKTGKRLDAIFEPDAEQILKPLVEAYLEACLENAYWESAAGEYCSRLVAMKNANENADLILETLHLSYNKIRQTKITQELSEIVSAFDVLKNLKEKKEKTEE
jgi:F-type H+-transporting ATPase subunit gamma